MIGNIAAGLYGTGVAPVTSSYESIATTVVGSGGASSITFSSIPSTYKHLQIRASARFSGGDLYHSITFNSQADSDSNNINHYLRGDGSSVSAAANANMAPWIWMPNNSQNSNVFNAAIIDVLDYTSTSKSKIIRTLNGWDNNGSGQVYLTSGGWFTASEAITSIKLNAQSFGSTSVFAQYSHFALYGIKD